MASTNNDHGTRAADGSRRATGGDDGRVRPEAARSPHAPPVLVCVTRSSGAPLVVPGCADALTARLAAAAGFECVYATGAGIANALLGVADVGLTSMTEIVDQVGRLCDAVDIP